MSMSRQHFKALADAVAKASFKINQQQTIYLLDFKEEIIDAIADACRQFNPRFNMSRFEDAVNKKYGELKGDGV